MTLTDAGPLVALIDADEADHETCILSLRTLTLPLVTTGPNQRRIFTLEDDFRIYRIHGRTCFASRAERVRLGPRPYGGPATSGCPARLDVPPLAGRTNGGHPVRRSRESANPWDPAAESVS